MFIAAGYCYIVVKKHQQYLRDRSLFMERGWGWRILRRGGSPILSRRKEEGSPILYREIFLNPPALPPPFPLPINYERSLT